MARQFYAGQTGLVLLVVDTRRLKADLKWERAAAPEGLMEEATFPHVYGPIELEAVVQMLDFEPDAAGEFGLPDLPTEAASEKPS